MIGGIRTERRAGFADGLHPARSPNGLPLIAIVIGGLIFAFGEGGSKCVIAGIVFGLGMALGATNFLNWLFPGSIRRVWPLPKDPPGWERIYEGSFLEAARVTQLSGDSPGRFSPTLP